MIDWAALALVPDKRLPVMVCAGEPVSDILSQLSGCLSAQDRTRLVVIAPLGQPDDWPLDLRFHSVQVAEVPENQGCFCCGAQSELPAVLQSLFIRILQRREPPVGAVIIVTATDLSEGLALMLRHAPFLGQRYRLANRLPLPLGSDTL